MYLATKSYLIVTALAIAFGLSIPLLGIQADSWKTHRGEGDRYHKQGKLAQAEQSYLAALRDARHRPGNDGDRFEGT